MKGKAQTDAFGADWVVSSVTDDQTCMAHNESKINRFILGS